MNDQAQGESEKIAWVVALIYFMFDHALPFEQTLYVSPWLGSESKCFRLSC